MNKQDIESILIANWYLIQCKSNSSSSDKVELARRYLVSRIEKALIDRRNKNKNQSKPFNLFSIK